MRKPLRKMNLSSKLVLLVFVCFVCIYIVLNTFWFFILERQAREDLIKNGYDMCILGNQMIEKECSYLHGIATYLSVSSQMQTFLHTSGTDRSNRLAPELANLKYPVSLVIYDLEGNPLDYMSIDASKTPVPQSPQSGTAFARVLHSSRTYEWEFIAQNSQRLFTQDNSPKLCLWKLVRDTKTTRPLGMIAITVDTRRIISMDSTTSGPYFQLIILDQKSGSVAFNHSSHVLTSETQQLLTEFSSVRASGDTILNYGGKRYRLFFSRSVSTPLTTYYLTPYTLFAQGVKSYLSYFLAVLSLLTLALFPLLRISSRQLTLPLRRLTDTVEGFAQGNLQAYFQYDGEDEIGKLGWVFNEMVHSHQCMMKKTVELKMREREAELNALQAQINPHFLFNMLNMIYWRALSSGNQELADISYAMGRLFRMTLRRDHTMITLHEEIEICDYYLMLQKKRYGDHIEYSISSEPEIQEANVPKLLLQPLVENAIIHGAENYSGVVNIQLTAQRDGDMLLLRVTNNGSVIPEEILRTLPYCPESISSPQSGNRFALRNIADRLKLLFENQGQISFESSKESGTIVTIRFPLSFFKPHEKEDNNHA